MQRLRVLIAAAAAAAAILAAAVTALPAQAARPARVEPGAAFPSLKLQALRSGGAEPSALDLGVIVGKKPLLICYIALGEPLGEEALTALQEKARAWKGTVEVMGAVKPSAGAGAAQVHERLSLLGIDLPVVIDGDFTLGASLGVTTSPSFSLVDKGGTLRIADARSLKQELPPGTTLGQAVETAGRGGAVATVTVIPRYYPANELVGEPFPDFMLKQFETGTRVKLSDRVAAATQGKKFVALLFWHPNCKHCKQAMPGIVAGYQTYARYMDLVSVVALKNEDEVVNARDTIRAHHMTFPVLEDEGRRVSDLYKVVSTPTMFFIKPDGKVDSVYLKGDTNFVPVFSAKLRTILGVASQLGSSRAN